MNFQGDKANIESAFDVLKQQSATTFENWDDPVQRRFYEQFINFLPRDVLTYLTELSKIDKSFDRAEQIINTLQD
jgi:hypothetical protein